MDDGFEYDIGGYIKILEKYGQSLSQGKNWDKVEDTLAGAKDYLNTQLGGDAKSAYNALKAVGDIYTVMSLDAKSQYGEEGVEKIQADLAEQTSAKYAEYKQLAEEAGMPKIAQYFEKIGVGLSELYGNSLAAYLQAEGSLKLTENAGKLANQLKDIDKQFTKQLEEMLLAIESISDRYGELS